MSSGQCILAAPEVFGQDDDEGVVLLKADRPPAGSGPDVRRAAMMCLARAITATEDED